MSESKESARTVTHQGKILRLSLPCNDYRDQELQYKNIAVQDLQHFDIESHLALASQTVNIFPDNGDDLDMRVVCSVSDRVQWKQKLMQIRERKLQELGVGQVSNVAYNAPIKMQKRASSSSSSSSSPESQEVQAENIPFWTGLHTPGVSTDSRDPEVNRKSRRSLSSDMPTHEFPESSQMLTSLTNQIASLQARQHQISRSVSDLIEIPSKKSHYKTLSQRELVHKRLSSIAPVVLRNPSRIVSSIGSIREEEDEEEALQHPDSGARAAGEISTMTSQTLVPNPYKLHQYLASNDMSELIRQDSVQFVPDFEQKVQGCVWADEPMESQFMHQGDLPPAQDWLYTKPSYGYMMQPSDTDLPYELKHPDQYYFWPQALSGSAGYFSDQVAGAVQADPYFPSHTAQRSSFNTAAEEFIPFSQAIVKPNPVSQAIPIIKPMSPGAANQPEVRSSGITDHESRSTTPTASAITKTYDAYHGFDSGSEASIGSEEHDTLEATEIDEQLLPDTNDVRVKAFKFPSPEKAKCLTPARPRSSLLNSESPADRTLAIQPLGLPPPKMSSTPRRVDRIFQKSVALEDNELDSIIMDLSVRNLPDRVEASSQELSVLDESDSEFSAPEQEQPPREPLLRRVPSAKLLLSHQDADMGLFLDAMLSAKLSSVTETLGGIQSHVVAIEEQVKALVVSTGTITETKVIPTAAQEEKLESLSQHPQRLDIELLVRRLEFLELSEAKEREAASNLRGELWNATAEIKRLEQSLIAQHVDGSVVEHENGADPVERLRLVEAAKTSLQKSVGELTTKASRLEGQLLETTTFCSALQTQYSSSELALAKLRKELNETQSIRDQNIEQLEIAQARYEILQEHMQETAKAIAEEQSRWLDSDMAKDAKIESLTTATHRDNSEIETQSRRSSTMSINNDVRMLQFLMDRVSALEHSARHTQALHKQELERKDARSDTLLADWSHMTSKLAKSESVIDGLRAELVLSTEFSDRTIEDLHRSHQVIDALTRQCQKTNPTSILKRSRSDAELENQQATSLLIGLQADLAQKDCRIAELERLLVASPDSTERQIMSAISEDITIRPLNNRVQETFGNTNTSVNSSECLSQRVKKLKQMRISWEAKAPIIIGN